MARLTDNERRDLYESLGGDPDNAADIAYYRRYQQAVFALVRHGWTEDAAGEYVFSGGDFFQRIEEIEEEGPRLRYAAFIRYEGPQWLVEIEDEIPEGDLRDEQEAIEEAGFSVVDSGLLGWDGNAIIKLANGQNLLVLYQ